MEPSLHTSRIPVHHRLLDLGLNHRQAAWVLYGVAGSTGLLTIVLSLLDGVQQVVVSAGIGVVLVGLYVAWRSRARKVEESEVTGE